VTLTSDRGRLYGLLEGLTGIVRKRDARLEKIAADRALEARYTVGVVLDGNDDIPHPVKQLEARTWPLQGTYKGVWENAEWVYGYPDPILTIADGWWNSAPHKANLVNVAATTWGIGLYVESYSGVNRYYAITVFTQDLKADSPPLPTIFTSRYGYKATILIGKPRRNGPTLASANLGTTTTNVSFTVYAEVVGDLVAGSTRWFWGAQYIGRWRHVFVPLVDLTNRNF
jgi:hypothetical protein